VTGAYPDQPYPPPGGYGGPPPGGYGGPPYGWAPVPRRGAGMATAALVLGIIAIVLCFTAFGGILLGLLAVVLGAVALRRARRGEAEGHGRAVAGVVTGGLGLVLGVVFLFVWLAFFRSAGVGDLVSCLQQAGNDTSAQQQCQQDFRDRYVPSAPSS
jgi:hypothetical protein